MELSEFVVSYCLEHPVCDSYRDQLEATARQLTEFSGGRLATAELRADVVNGWLVLLEGQCAETTVANKRRQLKTLWIAAHDAGLAPPVGRLRKIRVTPKIPEALSLDQIQRLIQFADRLGGCFNGTTTPRRLYLGSLFRAYYDSALRVTDLLSIERPWIFPGGFISLVQSKVKRAHRVVFRPETITAIDELLDGRTTGLIWPLWCHRRNFFKEIRRLFDAAGLPGSSKWVRRSSASYVERDNPGMGWRHLGHARPGLAESNYLAPSIVAPEPTLPAAYWE